MSVNEGVKRDMGVGIVFVLYFQDEVEIMVMECR